MTKAEMEQTAHDWVDDLLHGEYEDNELAELLLLLERVDREARAEVGAIRANLKALHSEHRVYDECGHEHTEDELEGGAGVIDVDNVGLTCEEGYLYSVCHACHTDDGEMREDSDEGKYPCATLLAAGAVEGR